MTSIIILSYNTLEVLRMCLESIRAHTLEEYELIVVDNASTDGSLEYLREQEDVRLIENKENLGFPRGCNQGLAIANGESLLLLNSDTVVTKNWLGNLQKGLYSDETVGAVSCLSNFVSNNQQIPVNYGTDMEAMQNFAARMNQSDQSKWEERPHLVGFCYLFKREVYEAIGGLDERFTPGNFEDNDYSLRIMEKGYKLLLLKDTFIHHWGSVSFKNLVENEKRDDKAYSVILSNNRQKFFEKWQLPPYYMEKSSADTRKYISRQREREGRLKEHPELLKKVAVVVPVYKESLSPTEEISLRQLRRVMPAYKKIFVVPEGLSLKYNGLEDSFEVQEFPRIFFQGIKEYSQLLLSSDFYRRFLDYEYILIHQLDVFIFEDRLLEFCDMGYDYIGAPCPKYDYTWRLVEAQVGNGGLSLRKIKSCLTLLKNHQELLTRHPYRCIFLNNEDSFFGYAGTNLPGFTVPDVKKALSFSIQDNIYHTLRGVLELPLGIHAFNKIHSRLWRQIIVKKYAYPAYEISKDDDFRVMSLHVYLRVRKIMPVQRLFGVIKKGKPQKALEIIKQWQRPKVLSVSDFIQLVAYMDTLVLYAKHKEIELREMSDIKASEAFREDLLKFIGIILKAIGSSAQPWILDLSEAAFKGVK